MKKLLIAVITMVALSMSVFGAQKGSIVVNCTSSDNIKAPMAVMFAQKGLEQGLDVTLFLNTDGVRLAVKGFNAPTNARNGKTTTQMIQAFVKKGGKVIVCPMCLEAQGYDKNNLIDNVTLGSAAMTFKTIMGSDKVISF